ncbi:ABC transporter substrate-binding protein [Paenibacillus sepulcri]|uniref:ABC transporter substrate-binding protein n=1 Tax=Paenibacillus sepulcri TaxID=359917 RepID=A0ABS7BX18_9BACL|nr:ABC transporter substrate-binding protein [Paenibacillus sepulcri]
MKQTKSKISLTGILILAIILILTACGGASNNGGNDNSGGNKPANETISSNNAAGKEDNAAAPASDLEPYELKVVYEGPPQPDEKKVEEAMNKLLKVKINATIDLMPIDWGAWDDKMNLMIASREPVDVLFTAAWNGYAKNVAKGAYLAADDLLQEYGKGILESLDPAFLEGSKIKGKNYGIPTNKELAAAGGIVYRKDIADELGLNMSAVKTAEDLDAIYKVVKEKKPDMIPLYTTGGLFTSHFFAETDFLGDSTIPGAIIKSSDDATVRMEQELDIYKRYLKVARDFYVKGYVNSDAATTQLASGDAYKAGNVFSTVEPIKPGKAAEIANAAGLSGKLDQITLTGKTVSTDETAGSMLAISSTSKDPARAMMFINLLHTDKELVNLINFGIEGDHYTRNGEIITSSANSQQYAPGVAWELGNQFLNYVWDSEDPDKWEKFREFNRNAKSSPALGFVFDSAEVKSEVGAIANVDKQYKKALETGSVDIDKVMPEYMAALKAAGVDKIIIAKQEQFDAFLAGK